MSNDKKQMNYSHKLLPITWIMHLNIMDGNIFLHWSFVLPKICVSLRSLPLCVGACSRISPVRLAPAGPGSTLTKTHKHTDTHRETHSFTHSSTWGNMNKPTSKIHLFLMHVWWDRQAAAGHCWKLQHRLACMTRWKQSGECEGLWWGKGTYEKRDETWWMC